MKTLCIDFDNTIHDIKHPVVGRRMGTPIKGAKDALERLHEEGYKIVIFTVRATNDTSKKVVEDWLNYYEIPFDDITNIKINADLYIDDKAVFFQNWKKTMIEVGRRTTL